MEPIFCPYCGERNIEELEPTEILVDTDSWVIYHYECQNCSETFDKIIFSEDLSEEIEDELEGENEKRYWS